jgi:predicted transcriptional regulator
MKTAKQRMLEIIQDQPEDSTYDELLKELAFGRMIERGLADSDAGRTISNVQMKAKIESWRE